jgi:hypothetical protein
MYENVAGLAVEKLADSIERREAHAFDMPRLEQGEVRFRDPYELGKVLGLRFAKGKHHIEANDDHDESIS